MKSGKGNFFKQIIENENRRIYKYLYLRILLLNI